MPNEQPKQRDSPSAEQSQKFGFRPVKTEQNSKKITIANEQNPYNTYYESKLQGPVSGLQFNQGDRKVKASNNASTNSNNGSNKSISRKSSINSRDGANEYSDGNRNNYQ